MSEWGSYEESDFEQSGEYEIIPISGLKSISAKA
jgi:hypothetical protein